jgi:predicted ATP-dependent Lon-type protease
LCERAQAARESAHETHLQGLYVAGIHADHALLLATLMALCTVCALRATQVRLALIRSTGAQQAFQYCQT